MKNAFVSSILFGTLALSGLAHAQAGAPVPPPPAPPVGAPVPAQLVTDPQIIGILERVNKAETEEAKYAKKQSISKPVKDYAEMMILQHKQMEKDLDHVKKTAKLKTEDSGTEAEIKKAGETNVAALKRVSKKELDRQYAMHQVAMHQTFLDHLDKDLIPSAQNPGLKDLLGKVRTQVADHLEKAKALESTIGSAS